MVETQVANTKKTDKEQKKKERRKFWLGFCFGVIGVLIATVLFTMGSYLYYKNKAEYKEEVKVDTQNTNDSVVNSTTTSKIKMIERLIKKNYYKDVDEETLADGIYRGMLDSLGDPYSEYYSAEDLKEVRESNEGIYYGIGAYVSLDTDLKLAVISGIISGTPAEEAGLQEGDLIYKVDGQDVTGMTTSEVVTLIRGEEFTTVDLTLIRDGETVEYTVERRKVESPTVHYEMLENNIGYIQITEFDDVTTDQFTEAMAVLKGQGMQALILDLRSNGGGNLSTCIDIANQLLPKGIVVYTEDKYGNREEYTCDGKRKFDKPMVVLVNGYSASASEILTGAIKDYGIGTIMGTTTYGKGIVQQIMSLKDGTAVKMTISKYYTPKGNYIHDIGIEPDIEVEFDADAYKKDKTDNQLNAAKEQIKKMMKD
ncbi:MAG: S41 family peptidase [Lachnospiraceae bacterium]|nr:S41 family peptidase [Lachnospiraceae bacterium]